MLLSMLYFMSHFLHLANVDNDLLLVQLKARKKLVLNCLFPHSRVLQGLGPCRDCSTGQSLCSSLLFPQDLPTIMGRRARPVCTAEIVQCPISQSLQCNFLTTLITQYWNQMAVENKPLSLLCFEMPLDTVQGDKK